MAIPGGLICLGGCFLTTRATSSGIRKRFPTGTQTGARGETPLENAAQSAPRPVINLTGTVLHTTWPRIAGAKKRRGAVTYMTRAGDAGIRFDGAGGGIATGRWRRCYAVSPLEWTPVSPQQCVVAVADAGGDRRSAGGGFAWRAGRIGARFALDVARRAAVLPGCMKWATPTGRTRKDYHRCGKMKIPGRVGWKVHTSNCQH